MSHSEIENHWRPAFTPIFLLGLCGLAFASKIMVSKAALDAGADPFQLGVVGNLGAGLLLSFLLIYRREGISVERRNVVLYLALGVLSVAAPTVISFFVVGRIGPAYTATVYSLSPILTMSFAAGIGLERMTVRRFSGIMIGFLGMLILVQQQLVAIDFAQTAWVVIGLLIPACAALGNVIRSAHWPKDASPLAFACATLITSSLSIAARREILKNRSRATMLQILREPSRIFPSLCINSFMRMCRPTLSCRSSILRGRTKSRSTRMQM